MLGKTHMVIGIAAGLWIMRPDDMPMLVVGTGASALGALLPDIDVGTSESHKDANVVIFLSVAVAVITFLVEHFWHLGIFEKLRRNEGWLNILIPAVIFIAICAFGKEMPHRSFMHSLLAMALLSGCVYYVFPNLAIYFLIGYASHLATDCLNRKRVMLFWPFNVGVALRLFHAHGVANTVCFLLGTVAAAGGMAVCIMNIKGSLT